MDKLPLHLDSGRIVSKKHLRGGIISRKHLWVISFLYYMNGKAKGLKDRIRIGQN